MNSEDLLWLLLIDVCKHRVGVVSGCVWVCECESSRVIRHSPGARVTRDVESLTLDAGN